ncbi:MAG: RNA polymerase sigma factor [Anaerovoracaceae bacterium]
MTAGKWDNSIGKSRVWAERKTWREQEMIEEILERYKGVIKYEVRKILLQSEALQEDAMQETWIRIYRSLPAVASRQGKQQENYIRVIARNAAKDVRSQEWKRRGWENPLNEEDFPVCDDYRKAETVNPELNRFRMETEEMENCLLELTQKERDVLYLRYVEEADYEEMAIAFHTSEGNCRQMVLRAKRSLAQIMDKHTECEILTEGRVKQKHGKE